MKLTLGQVIEEIKKEEGFRSKVYKCTSGKHTIGYGRNLDDNGITVEEATDMLIHDISICDWELKHSIPVYCTNLNGARQYVILSMCYNMGLTNLLKFKNMWKAIKDEDFTKASMEMLDSKWAKQVKSRALKLSVIMKTGEMPK